MSGNKTTNITQTGLGDDQYQKLQENQQGLGTQIEEGFSGAETKLDGISTGITGLGTNITNLGNTVNANTNTGFSTLSDLLSSYGDTLTQGQTDAAAGRKTYYDNMLTALENNTGGLQTALDTGFADAAGRFDDIDQSTSNIQTSVDQGFQDATADRTQMQTDINDAFTTQNTGLGEAFTGLGDDIGTAFNTTNTNIADSQSALQEGQTGLEGNLSDLSGNLDAYGTSLVQGQEDMSANQDNFQSSFDDYVDRYSDDTTLANQARADIATAQANATTALREDIGNYAQAAAQGQSNIGKRLGDLGEGTAAGFEVLSGAVEGGFSDVSTSDQLAQQNLTDRIGNVKSLLETTGDTLDANTKAQYEALSDSFDANGELITNSIDAQGNTISRAMDDQGNIIETKFDSAGNEIGKVQMDVETMLANAEAYQTSLTGQITGLQGVTESGFTGVGNALGTGFQDTEASILQGIQTQSTDVANLFEKQSGTLNTQGQDLLDVLAAQEGTNDLVRKQADAASKAFDAQGQLIGSYTDDLGNMFTNQLDAAGNLLTQQIDANGQIIESTTTNITDLLGQAAQFQADQFGSLDRNFIETRDTLSDGFAAQSTALTAQGKSIASSLANQEGLDATLREQASTISAAFTDTGELIQNTTDNLGNTVTNAIDQNGNLITQKFDQAGQLIQESTVNVNDVLSQGFQGVSNQVTDIGTALRDGFNATDGTLSTQAQDILNVASTIETFDAATQSQFADISSAFDAQGNLIQESTDNVGNTILRQLDANGNLLTQKLDANGNVLDQSNSNINEALGAIQQQTGSLSDRLTAGFQDVARGQTQLTDTVQTGQEGLMSEQVDQRNRLQNQMSQIQTGFDTTEGKMDTQIRDLARVAASQGDIAIENRQEFKQIGDAFDDQGNLIRNSIDASGNTISRAIDDNGNLLLRSFDVNGRAIGDKVLNINKSLNQLAQLPYMAGANTSMGNLSPAMKANVPQGGFMSPFAQTR